MKQYFALVAAGKVVSLNHEELPDPIPDGLTIKTLTQSQYEDLVANFNYNLVVNEANTIVTDELAAAKYDKIKEAREYFDSIDKFILDEDECKINKTSLRNLFTDLLIREKDIAINGIGACEEPIKGSEYISGYTAGSLSPTSAMEVCIGIRCYKRAIEANLDSIILGINSCTTVLDVTNYDETDNYPSIPNF